MHYYAYPYWPYPYYHTQRLVFDPYITPYNEPIQTQAVADTPSPFPPVDTKLFNKSAQKYQELMKQTGLFVDKVATSHQFANNLMEAAQLSNKEKVNELILSTGITIKVETHFTPTGIILVFDNAETEVDCCNLRMVLRW